MMRNQQQFREELHRFVRDNQRLLRKGKALLEAMDDPKAKAIVEKPFLFKIILEKYLEIIEDKMLPALPAVDEQRPEAIPRANASHRTDPAYRVDDFRTGRKNVVNQTATQEPSRTASAAKQPQKPMPPVAESKHEGGPLAPDRGAAQSNAPTQHGPVETAKATPGPDPKTLIDSHPGSRRVVPRYSCHLPLSYSVKGKDSRMMRAYSKDVGAMGLFIMANRPEKKGDQVAIEVDIPEMGIAQIQAVVAWTKWVPQNLRAVDYPGFGVRVTNATENWYTYFMNA